MTVVNYANNTQTCVVGTEHFLSNPNAIGEYELELDLINLAAGDVLEVRIYKMVLTGGTQRQLFYISFAGAQSVNLINVTDWIPNTLTDTNALRFSIKQTFGTGRNVPWAVLQRDDALKPATAGRTLVVDASGLADANMVKSGPTGSGTAQTASDLGAAIYQAKLWLDYDNTNTTDRYSVVWFKNGVPVLSGITSPTIEVIKYSDGSDLIASTAMTQIGSTGMYKYDATSSARITKGASYMAVVTATIDAGTRTWVQPISRDS